MAQTNSYVTYDGDGSTTDFAVPFEFISREHVTVKVNNDVTNDWFWLNDGMIRFNTAPAEGVPIMIERTTSIDSMLVDFAAGYLSERDLDLAYKHVFFLSQEAVDKAGAGAAESTVLAEKWATHPEDTVVQDGKFSALHYASKASQSAAKARLWAEEDEDVEVEPGEYSAKHHAAKAEASANRINLPVLTSADAGKRLRVNSDGTGYVLVEHGGNFRNLIINGAFDVWQRGSTFLDVGGGTYTADRWVHGKKGSAVVNVRQSTVVPDKGSRSSLEWEVVTAATSLGSGDYNFIEQRIEGVNCRGLRWGTSAAAPITISFWVWSSKAGVHSGAIVNGNGTRGYPFEFTVSTPGAWEWHSLTIPGDQTGTWDNGSGIGLLFRLATAVGTNFQGPAGAWASGNFIGTANQINLQASVGNKFRLSRVQLEIGEQATDFEFRPRTVEELLCNRYLEAIGDGTNVNVPAASGYANNTGATYVCIACGQFSVPKRVVPDMIRVGSFNVSNVAQPVGSATRRTWTIYAVSTGTGRTFFNPQTGAYFLADAEL